MSFKIISNCIPRCTPSCTRNHIGNHNNATILERGLTLIEVLVSFMILSMLLTLILQGQAENIHFIIKTKEITAIRHEVEEQVLAMQREDDKRQWSSNKGIFPSDHPLAGMKYEREETVEQLLGTLQVKKVTFKIQWMSKGVKQNYESSFYKS